MAEFKDLDEFLDETLRLPIGGKVYKVAAPDAATGLQVEKLFAAGVTAAAGGTPQLPTVLNDTEETDLWRRLLGDTYQQLLDDGVSHLKLKHVGMTTMIWTVLGLDAAERYWKSGGRPEAPAPNRATRRAKATKSSSTAAASTTRRRGSGSTTTSPTTSGHATPAPRTRGRKS